MFKRAERKTPGELLTNYSNNFSNSLTEYSGVFYHFSVSEPIRDSGQRLLTRLEDLWLLDVRELNERNRGYQLR